MRMKLKDTIEISYKASGVETADRSTLKIV